MMEVSTQNISVKLLWGSKDNESGTISSLSSIDLIYICVTESSESSTWTAQFWSTTFYPLLLLFCDFVRFLFYSACFFSDEANWNVRDRLDAMLIVDAWCNSKHIWTGCTFVFHFKHRLLLSLHISLPIGMTFCRSACVFSVISVLLPTHAHHPVPRMSHSRIRYCAQIKNENWCKR